MKKIKLILALFVASFTLFVYDGLSLAGVFFSINEDSNSTTSYTYLSNPDATEATMEIQVNISGDTTSYERYFNVEIVEEASDYKEEHIKSAKGVVPAGSSQGTLYVTIGRTSEMDSRDFTVAYTIIPSEDFPEAGYNKSYGVFTYSNIVSKPAEWDFFLYDWYGTTYSNNFYEFVINTTGVTDYSEFYNSEEYIQEEQDYLDYYMNNYGWTMDDFIERGYVVNGRVVVSSVGYESAQMDVYKREVLRGLQALEDKGTPLLHNDGTKIVLP